MAVGSSAGRCSASALRGLLIGKDSDRPEVVAIREPRSLEDECPPISPGSGRDVLDAESARPRRRWTDQRLRRASTLRHELDFRVSSGHRLEIRHRGQMHGKQRRTAGDERRVLHEQFSLVSPVRDAERGKLVAISG